MAGAFLIEFFIERGSLERLEPFLSEFGARFYGYPMNEGTVTFVRKPQKVPDEVPVPELGDSIVPMYAGETIEWQIAE